MDAFLAQLPQLLINGLTLGAVYALIALGYSMVYGVLQLLNFAHGDVYMIGAYIGFGVMAALTPADGPLLAPVFIIILMMLLAMLGCGVLGVVIEQFAYRPLRNSPRIAPLISALGVSFFIQNAVQLTLTAQFRIYETEKLIAPKLGIPIASTRLSASDCEPVAATTGTRPAVVSTASVMSRLRSSVVSVDGSAVVPLTRMPCEPSLIWNSMSAAYVS